MVKQLKNQQLSEDAFAEFLREAELSSRVSGHPNVTTFFGACVDKEKCAMVFECALPLRFSYSFAVYFCQIYDKRQRVRSARDTKAAVW